MLSTAAWNAFLKTLEEPPPNTIFVLATTEANKVLPTVVDRCHRFDFAPPDASSRSPSVLRRVADGRGDRDPRRGGRADRPLGDRLVPRRARHARAARHLLGHDDRARRRARRARRRRRRPAVRRGRRGRRRRRRARRCSRAARLADSGRDLGRFFARPRGPRARADGRADARRGARRAARHRRAGRAAGRAGRARRRRPTSCALLDLLAAGAARDEGRRRRPHPARARARQGRRRRRSTPSREALLARIERLEAGRAGAAPRAAPRRRAAPRGRRRRPPRRAADAAPRAPRRRRRRRPTPPAAAEPPAADAAAAADARPADAAPAADAAGRRAAAVAVVEPDGAGVAAVELDLDVVAELWPAVLESLAGRSGRCSPRACRRAPDRARRRRADARVARVRRVLQAQGRGRRPTAS